MNLLTGIVLFVFLLLAIFVASWIYANWQAEKDKYLHAITMIESAIKKCNLTTSNYYHIIHELNDLCKYRYQDHKRNQRAAMAFKERFWRLHALNGGKI